MPKLRNYLIWICIKLITAIPGESFNYSFIGVGFLMKKRVFIFALANILKSKGISFFYLCCCKHIYSIEHNWLHATSEVLLIPKENFVEVPHAADKDPEMDIQLVETTR